MGWTRESAGEATPLEGASCAEVRVVPCPRCAMLEYRNHFDFAW